MRNTIKTIIFVIAYFLAFHFMAYSATYNQASQAWVNNKMNELESRLRNQINDLNASLISITNKEELSSAIMNVVEQNFSTSSDKFRGIMSYGLSNHSTNDVKKSAYMIYEISDFFNRDGFTNVVEVGSFLYKKNEGVYTNSVMTITELTEEETRLEISYQPFGEDYTYFSYGDNIYYDRMSGDKNNGIRMFKCNF